MFHSKNNTLGEHIITFATGNAEQGLYLPTALVRMTESAIQSNRIEQVRTFGGSAFKMPPEATSLLTLGKGAASIVPEVPFQVNADTPRVPINGWSQGALIHKAVVIFANQKYAPTLLYSLDE